MADKSPPLDKTRPFVPRPPVAGRFVSIRSAAGWNVDMEPPMPRGYLVIIESLGRARDTCRAPAAALSVRAYARLLIPGRLSSGPRGALPARPCIRRARARQSTRKLKSREREIHTTLRSLPFSLQLIARLARSFCRRLADARAR